jgi:predicted dehydrogenase
MALRPHASDQAPKRSAAGSPVLTETPPGLDLDTLHRLHALAQGGARIQVAEQYHLQPLVRVQLELARSGPLGDVHYSHCSLAHDYHGVSVLRRVLGIGFDDATIRARQFRSPLTAGPDRTGDAAEERTVTASQVIAELDFGDRLGVYDFSTEHYFSWIRTRELLIRGTRGEVRGNQLRYLQDFRTPIGTTITRSTAGVDGNHEGAHLRGLLGGDRWLYRNTFRPARLNDDELAVAECLARMAAFAEGGPDLYSLAEAAQDHYLQLMMRQAVESGEAVRTTAQPWTPR